MLSTFWIKLAIITVSQTLVTAIKTLSGSKPRLPCKLKRAAVNAAAAAYFLDCRIGIIGVLSNLGPLIRCINYGRYY